MDAGDEPHRRVGLDYWTATVRRQDRLRCLLLTHGRCLLCVSHSAVYAGSELLYKTRPPGLVCVDRRLP